MNFVAIVQNGKLTFKNDFIREKFAKFVKTHEGRRLFLTPTFKESDNQRGFFEGAVVKLVTFFQDGMDYTSSEDCRNVREWLKIEFNGDFVVVNGKSTKVGKSTKGKLNEGFLERVIDWIEENYGVKREDVLNPKEYKRWQDEIYPYGGPETYIDYLIEIGLLKK